LNNLAQGGLVRIEIEACVRAIRTRLDATEAMQMRSAGGGGGWSLKVKTSDGAQRVTLANLPSSMSTRELVRLIEENLEGSFRVSRCRFGVGNSILQVFDDRTLLACGIQSNDVLVVEGSSFSATTMTAATSSSSSSSLPQQQQRQQQQQQQQSQIAVVTGLDRWKFRGGLWPRSRFEAFVLALHCFMLDEGFVCIEEVQNSSAPGFAPPLREVSHMKLLPDRWNEDQSSCTLMYKHSSKIGKHFSLSIVLTAALPETIFISLSQKNGDSFSTEVSLASFLREQSCGESGGGSSEEAEPESLFSNLQGVAQIIRSLVVLHIPPPQQQTQTASRLLASNEGGGEPHRSYPPHGGSSSVPSPYTPLVGDGDLNPYFPMMPGGLGPIQPGGTGSLVGPNHPIFGPQGDVQSGRGPFPIPGLPQPRFDPYGPVAGPHGPNFGNIGMGPNRGRAPGEPDPDHLRPPDDDAQDPLNPRPFGGGRAGGLGGRGGGLSGRGGGGFGGGGGGGFI